MSLANVKPRSGGRNQNPALAARKSPWLASSLWLAAFLLWLLNHPYQGIWHDARGYGLIAAHWIYPDALANDVFFRFGSQADLSLFTPLYGELVRWLGLDTAARLVVLSGAMLWVSAWALLARVTLGGTLAGCFAVLFGAAMSLSYSPNGMVFMLGENFATARSWALPCGLLAVAWAVAGRWPLAIVSGLLAFLLHPLLGVWSLALLAMPVLPGRWLPALALLPALATAIAGAFGGIDLPGLQVFTGAMLDFIHAAPDIVFKPGASRLPDHLLPLVLLLLGARAGSAMLRPWYLRLFYLGGGTLVLAWVSVVFPLEIVVQGQPWRVTWLTLPIAGVALLDVLQTLHRASPEHLAVSWLCAMLLALITLGAGLAWAWLALGVIALALSFLPLRFYIAAAREVQHRRHAALAVVSVLWALALPGLWTQLEIAGARFLGVWWPGAEVLHGLVAGGSWLFPLLLAIIFGTLPKWRAATPVALVLLVATVGVTLAAWDWRSAPRRAEEARWLAPGQAAAHPFARLIPPGEVVAWPERETTVWFELHTASYVGEIQRTGSMFSKEKFALLNQRAERLRQTDYRRELCRDPELDWVVARTPAPGVLPVAQTQDWGLYPCHGH